MSKDVQRKIKEVEKDLVYEVEPVKVKLLKDWGDHKQGAELEIGDQTVLDAGREAGLFK